MQVIGRAGTDIPMSSFLATMCISSSHRPGYYSEPLMVPLMKLLGNNNLFFLCKASVIRCLDIKKNNNAWYVTQIVSNSFNPHNGYCYHPHFTGEKTEAQRGSWSKVIGDKGNPEYSRYWHCQANTGWGGEIEDQIYIQCSFWLGQLPTSSHQILMATLRWALLLSSV